MSEPFYWGQSAVWREDAATNLAISVESEMEYYSIPLHELIGCLVQLVFP